MRTFAFRFDPLYRVLAAPFGIVPSTASVTVCAERLEARFGFWYLEAAISNVQDWTEVGPFTRPKTIGPAHLSLADRGLTFATNADQGVCIRFRQPVAAIEPFGMLRHPGLTVTIDDVEEFQASLTLARDGTGPEPAAEPHRSRTPMDAVKQWVRRPIGAWIPSQAAAEGGD